jgi:hypothetical protein
VGLDGGKVIRPPTQARARFRTTSRKSLPLHFRHRKGNFLFYASASSSDLPLVTSLRTLSPALSALETHRPVPSFKSCSSPFLR